MTNEELAVLIQQGQRQYIQKLYEQVRKLLRVIALRYFNRFCDVCTRCGITEDDLIQEGFFVMMDAVRAFQSESGNKFTTYLHFPFENRFQKMTGHRRGTKNPLNQADSLDEPLSMDDTDFTRGDTIPDENAAAQFDAVDTELYETALHTALEKSLDSLNPQQRTVIRCRYYENMTLQATGDQIGCNRERVRQHEQKALRCLRKPKAARALIPFLYDEMESGAYRGTGLTSFRHTGVSSTERTAERMEELEQLIAEVRRLAQEDIWKGK